MEEIMDDYKTQIEQKKKKVDEAHLQTSKKRLIAAIEKKFSTANIGILALVEKHFGGLWAHGENRELTQEENQWRNIWSILRTEILDHGNHQKRGAINEISEYSLNWEKYHMNFLPVALIKKDD